MMHIYDTGTCLIRRQSMSETFDEYIDQFTLGGGAYGIVLNFKKSSSEPAAPGNVPQADDIGTIRMSLEHFKVMIFVMKRQMDDIEEQFGIEIPLPVQVMNSLKIAPEDWSGFWRKQK